MTWSPDTSTASVFVTLVLQGIIGSVVYILFECVRGQREIYWPKRRTKPHRCPAEDPSLTVFGWTWCVLRRSDEETLQLVGTDGFVLLRYLRMCTRVCLGCGAFACALLLPVYATGFGDDETIGISRLTMANITAGGTRLWAPFFCTWIFTLVLLYALYKEYEHFVHLRHQFLAKGDVDMPVQHLYSVVAENIPKEYQTSAKLFALFESLFPGEVASAQVGIADKLIVAAHAERVVLVAKLEQAVAQYEASDREDKPMLSLKGGEVVMCRGEEEVEAIPYYLKEVQRLNTRLQALKEQAKECGAGTTASADRLVVNATTPGPNTGHSTVYYSAPTSPNEDIEANDNDETRLFTEDLESGAPKTAQQEQGSGKDSTKTESKKADKKAKGGCCGGTDEDEEDEKITVDDIAGTGFVTFRSKCTQMTAAQVDTLSSEFPTLRAFAAPTPSNLIWFNVPASLDYIRFASLMTKIAYYAGLLFWTLILAFISAISSLSNLEKYLPFLKDLDPFSYALLEGQLPVIALIVFIALLPVIFTAVSTYIERRKTVVEVKMEVFTWFFAYQIANVYLILLAGSLFGALSDAINNPASVIQLLASSLPGVSTFFLNLMITYLFTGVPLTLLRLVPVLMYKLYRMCFNPRKLTRRTLVEGPLADVTVDYSTLLAQFLYVMCIALTYWVIAPILVFVAGLIFGANYAVYKYQLCYIMVNNNETGGLYFYKLFNYTMVGLMASTITMIGYTGIKEGAIQAPLMAPLPVIIYIVWCYTEEKFKDLSLGLTYQQALHSDNSTPKEDALEGGHTTAAKLQADFFQHPLLRGRTDALPQVYRLHADAPSYAAIAKGAHSTTGDSHEGETIPLLTEEQNLHDAYHAFTSVELEELAQQLGVTLDTVDAVDGAQATGSPLRKKNA